MQPFRRREQRRASSALHDVSAQSAKLDAVRRVEQEVAAQHLRRLVPPIVLRRVVGALPQAGVTDEPFRQLLPQPQVFPSERQVGYLVFASGGMARRRQHLEAPIKQNRMQVETAAVNDFRQDDLADRLTIRRPEALKRAER